MAIKGKPLIQELVMAGDSGRCLEQVRRAFESGGFTKVQVDAEACECRGNFHKGTIWGELRVQLDDDGPGQTRLHLYASAGKDNIWTILKGDPNERIVDRFTRCLPPAPAAPAAAPSDSVAAELERLVGLRDQGVLSATEFEVAKTKVLGGS
jgi:hypothetical protein